MEGLERISDRVWEVPVSHKRGMLAPARIFPAGKLVLSMDEAVFEQVTHFCSSCWNQWTEEADPRMKFTMFAYWSATAMIALELPADGVLDLMRQHHVAEIEIGVALADIGRTRIQTA